MHGEFSVNTFAGYFSVHKSLKNIIEASGNIRIYFQTAKRND
jgi:hypothetical protein